MRLGVVLGAPVIVALLGIQTFAGPFVVFPKAGQLVSPDGRFVVRNVEREAKATEFAGNFRSLWLTEIHTGRTRKLCDYVGIAAVAWSGNDSLIVTQYLTQETSRALIFSVTVAEEPIVVDVPGLIRLVPAELRPALKENDHVFVEASRLEGESLFFRVWGYGKHDADGFRWRCEYNLNSGTVSCSEEHARR